MYDSYTLASLPYRNGPRQVKRRLTLVSDAFGETQVRALSTDGAAQNRRNPSGLTSGQSVSTTRKSC